MDENKIKNILKKVFPLEHKAFFDTIFIVFNKKDASTTEIYEELNATRGYAHRYISKLLKEEIICESSVEKPSKTKKQKVYCFNTKKYKNIETMVAKKSKEKHDEVLKQLKDI